MHDILALEVALLRYAVILHEYLCIFAWQDCLNLCRCPDEKLAFLSLAVSILRGIETTFRRGHLAHNIIQRLLSDTAIEGIARHQVGVQVDATEQRVIIQHLLKMRDEPFSIDGVTV